MIIYAIRRDGYKFQELDLEIDDFIEQVPDNISYHAIHDFSVENIALASFWQPIRTGFSEIEGERNFIPDITPWIGATLLLSPKSHRYLYELLRPYGEFLPVIIENDTYQIFNCLTLVEEHFQEPPTEKKVFKLREQHCLDVHCTNLLKDAVESFDLRGIIFEKVQ